MKNPSRMPPGGAPNTATFPYPVETDLSTAGSISEYLNLLTVMGVVKYVALISLRAF